MNIGNNTLDTVNILIHLNCHNVNQSGIAFITFVSSVATCYKVSFKLEVKCFNKSSPNLFSPTIFIFIFICDSDF